VLPPSKPPVPSPPIKIEPAIIKPTIDAEQPLPPETFIDKDSPAISSSFQPNISEQLNAPICSPEHCPLLTNNEQGSTAQLIAVKVAKQMRDRFREKRTHRQRILAWTVTIQICILIGVSLFVTKSLFIPKERPIAPLTLEVSETKKAEEPVYHVPEPVRPNIETAQPKIAQNNVEENKADELPPFPVVEPPPALLPPIPESPGAFGYSPPTVLNEEHVQAPLPLPPQPKPEPPTVSISIEAAETLYESAAAALASDPEKSVTQAVQAVKMYEQLGKPLPDSLYWLLGNAFAALSWGEPLLEGAPAVESMTLSGDNRWLLAQLKDKTVWLWDLNSSAEDRGGYLLDPGTASYVKFIFTPDLRWIIGGQTNGTIRIWDMTLKNPADTVITLAERIPELQDIQLSPNGQWLAAFGNASWSIPLSENYQAGQAVRQVAFQRSVPLMPEGTSFPVLLWNLRQMEGGVIPAATPLPPMPQQVQVIRFSPSSDRLAVGRKDAVVRVYDLTVRGVADEPFILRGHQLGITQIVFAPGGQWLATGSQDNTIRLWNLANSKVAPESVALYGHLGWVSALAVDKSGEYLYSGSYDRTIRIWNVKRNRIDSAAHGKPIVLEANLGVPEFIAATQDGDKLIAMGNEGGLSIYHLPSVLQPEKMESIRSITLRNSKLSISRCAITSDNRMLIFSYDNLSNLSNNGIRLWTLLPQPFIGE
jgi:WD40 repeat protein